MTTMIKNIKQPIIIFYAWLFLGNPLQLIAKALFDGETAHSNFISVLDENRVLLYQELGSLKGVKALSKKILNKNKK